MNHKPGLRSPEITFGITGCDCKRKRGPDRQTGLPVFATLVRASDLDCDFELCRRAQETYRTPLYQCGARLSSFQASICRQRAESKNGSGQNLDALPQNTNSTFKNFMQPRHLKNLTASFSASRSTPISRSRGLLCSTQTYRNIMSLRVPRNR